MPDKDKMSANRLAAVNEEVARLNARAVVQRMEEMQGKLDECHRRIDQMANQFAQLQAQMQLQQTLANQIAKHGRGPTT